MLLNSCFLCRYDLHVLLVNHGKRCARCAKNGKPRKESDGACPLFGKNGLASIKKQPTHSADELIKSEEDSSDVCNESPKTAKGRQPGTVKQEPSEADEKQGVDAGPAKTELTVKEEAD